MLGITTGAQLGFTESSVIGKRPAANIGIYARVIHNEQKSKDSFKVFSVLINACYFLQIVFAAGLTAMSAASVASGAVTAFGAINTIMAGFLTFLKGSGLPGRLKYYGNEWKKIREYIEQRERDFAREGCTLDVYDVVAAIEQMYTHTKHEIEANTPDNYASVTSSSRYFTQENDPRVAGIDTRRADGLAAKLQALDGAVGKLTSGIESKTQGVAHSIHHHEKAIEKEIHGLEKAVVHDVDDYKARLEREASDRRAQADQAADNGRLAVGDISSQVRQAGEQAVRDVRSLPARVVEEVRGLAAGGARKAADGLDSNP